MLSFDDEAHFQDTYDCLEQAYEDWNDSIEVLYAYLSDEDYNDLLDSIGFMDEQPLINFEQLFNGYHSYRRSMQIQEDAWLLAGGDPATDPDNNNVLSDLLMEALLNQNAAVMIGGAIHMTLPDGSQVEITNGDCSIYECFVQDPGCQQGGTNVIVLKSSTNRDCRDNAEQYGWEHYDSNKKRLKWRMKFKYSQLLDVSRCQIEMTSQRKKNGKWKKYKTQLGYVVRGPYGGGDEYIGRSNNDSCDVAYHNSELRAGKRRSHRWLYDLYPTQLYYYQMRQGDIQCVFNYNGQSFTHDLTW